jgi:hypothetical protein
MPSSTRALAIAGLVLGLCAGGGAATAQARDNPVEKLLKAGWEIAGYVAAWENRSLILLKHREHQHLVQCSVLIDVTRNPRVVTACYEIR